jgi:uncharacterized membrane protein YdjX (TVP38/TMEM64 family)
LGKRRPLFKLALLPVLLAAVLVVAHRLGWLEPRGILDLVGRLRAAGPREQQLLLFAIVQGVATAVALPSAPFGLAGGAMFGVVRGIAVTWTGAMLGAAGGYWLARTLGSDTVLRLLGRRREMLGRMEGLSGFVPLLRLRLLPLVPFGAVNVIAGLAGVDFRVYLLATAVGILPSTIVYVYFADAIVARSSTAQQTALAHIVIASVLLLVLSFAPAIVNRLQRQRRLTTDH